MLKLAGHTSKALEFNDSKKCVCVCVCVFGVGYAEGIDRGEK